MIIHANPSKNKTAEKEERKDQREGNLPLSNNVSPQFKAGIDDPSILVTSTSSGSMTQETFYFYCEHFVASLENNHLPVLLLLDGHGSHLSVPALEYLMRNDVFPFFIASHTSIWAQPNDAGVNKWYHWAVEEVARHTRRSRTNTPNIEYFNTVLSTANRKFMEAERCELRSLGYNNTTNAFERTGLQPFNPFCLAWKEAIDTLGLLQEDKNSKKVHYKVLPKQETSIPELTDAERKLLREPYQGPIHRKLLDLEIALLRGEEILAKWRQQILAGVQEGNDYESYAKSLPPSTGKDNDIGLKLAEKMIEFHMVDISKVSLPTKKNKNEKIREHSEMIVKTTKKFEPISITCLTDLASPADSSTATHAEGIAIKINDGKWKIMIQDIDEYEINDSELLDNNKYQIKHTFQTVSSKDSKRAAQKNKRGCQHEQREKEVEF